MRAEDYQRRRQELAGWPVGIVSYKLGDRFICEIDNVNPGARGPGRGRDARGGGARRHGERRAPSRPHSGAHGGLAGRSLAPLARPPRLAPSRCPGSFVPRAPRDVCVLQCSGLFGLARSLPGLPMGDFGAAASNRLVQAAAARWRQGVVRNMVLRITSILRIKTSRASLRRLSVGEQAPSSANQGKSRSARRSGQEDQEPAAICTWRMIGRGAPRSASTGRPSPFQAWTLPARWHSSTGSRARVAAAAWRVRLPLHWSTSLPGTRCRGQEARERMRAGAGDMLACDTRRPRAISTTMACSLEPGLEGCGRYCVRSRQPCRARLAPCRSDRLH